MNDINVKQFLIDLDFNHPPDSLKSFDIHWPWNLIHQATENFQSNEIHLFICHCSKAFLEKKNFFKLSSPEIFQPLIHHYISPQCLIEKTDLGKPYVFLNEEKALCQVGFSHSKDLLVLAFVRNFDIGVDIEYIEQNRSMFQLISKYYSEIEKNWIEKSKDAVTAFYRLWTMKEALIKSKGGSVFNDLRSSLIPENLLIHEIEDNKWMNLESDKWIWQNRLDNYILSVALTSNSNSNK